MSLRFLHGGDFHLDSPFHALSPQQAVTARENQRGLLDRFRLLAEEQTPDVVFLTGDLFDGARVYPETIKAFREMLEGISAEIFLSPGNHDPYTPTSPYARLSWPSHVHIFQDSTVTAIELPHLDCTVYGSAFTSSHCNTSPLDGLTVSGDGLHFGCFHGEVTQGQSRYGPISQSQIADSKLHYLALGHIHASSGLCRSGHTYYAYPGCIQGRGFDETGEKGVLFGTCDDSRLNLDFIPLCSHCYRIHTVDLAGQSPEDAIQRILPETPTSDIVRILLKGERDEDGALPLSFLQQLAEPYYYSVTLFDQTELPRNLWAKEEEDSLQGYFLRNMHRRLQEATEEEKPRLELAVRFALAALEGREEPQ